MMRVNSYYNCLFSKVGIVKIHTQINMSNLLLCHVAYIEAPLQGECKCIEQNGVEQRHLPSPSCISSFVGGAGAKPRMVFLGYMGIFVI